MSVMWLMNNDKFYDIPNRDHELQKYLMSAKGR